MKQREKRMKPKGRTRMMRPDGGYRSNEQVHKAKHKYNRKVKHKNVYGTEEE